MHLLLQIVCLPARVNRKIPAAFMQANKTCPLDYAEPKYGGEKRQRILFEATRNNKIISPKLFEGHTHAPGRDPETDESKPIFLVAELKPVRGVLQQMTSSYFTHQNWNLSGPPNPPISHPNPSLTPRRNDDVCVDGASNLGNLGQ